MADELLTYYNRELSYLRKLGGEFSELHPKIAARLRLTGDAVEDPHVSRLLEGVAFLNARIRLKLDDEFPELTGGILGQLYPHYLAPIPSMAVIQLRPARDLTESFRFKAGSEVETEPVGGEICRYRTAEDLTLWPVDIDSASLTGRPLVAPQIPDSDGCVAVLRLSLKCLAEDMTFARLGLRSLRFFLRGASTEAFHLLELILNNVAQVACAESTSDPNPVILDPSVVRPVGFAANEGVLPSLPRSAVGYRLLTEYFAFPERFLFFDLVDLPATARRKLNIYLYLTRAAPELERRVAADSFALGCVPMINLFRQRAEPIELDETVAEYPIIPDSRRPGALEIYSVDQVTASSRSGDVVSFAPLFGLKHAAASRRQSRFWHSARRPAGGRDPACESFLTVVDLDGDPSIPAGWVASVQTTCLNRELPGKLPFGGGHPHLRLVQPASAIDRAVCLTPPTPTLRLPTRKEGAWRLISHLNLNHLSLADGDGGADALREILLLYDFRDAPETRALIDTIVSIRVSRGVARAPDPAMGALCRGLDVTIEFDERRAAGSGVFLLAAVLDRFIANYASINAFTRLTATAKGRAGVIRTWPARAGELQLL
jgi:type VI secretion system protein ImpG